MSLRSTKKRKARAVELEVVPPSPLHKAIVDSDCAAIGKLLAEDAARVNQKFPDKHYPITLAALEGSAAVVTQLLAAGADTKLWWADYPKKFSSNAPRALHLASTRADGADIIRALYKHDPVGCGENPLVWAAVYGRAENIAALHEGGAPVNARFYMHGRTPINMAIANAPLDALLPTLTALVQAGETLQKGVASFEDTTLHSAAQRRADMSPVIEWLVKNGCDVNYRMQDRRTWNAPLHVAALDGSAATMRALIKQGADVNLQTNACRTPLHLAVTDVDFEKMRLLVEAGADSTTKDHKGKTVIDYLTPQPNEGAFMQVNECFSITVMTLDNMDQEHIDTGRPGPRLSKAERERRRAYLASRSSAASE